MSLEKIINGLNFPEEILNTEVFITVPVGFENDVIHADSNCNDVTGEAVNYYDGFENKYFEGDVSEHEIVSLNYLKENSSKYCFYCYEDFPVLHSGEGNVEDLTFTSFVNLFKTVLKFFETESTVSNEGFVLLHRLTELNSLKNHESLISSYKDKLLQKLKTSTGSYPLNNVSEFHELLIKEIILEKYGPAPYYFEKDEKLVEDLVKKMRENKNYVLFSTSYLDVDMFTNSFQELKHSEYLRQIFLNPTFELSSFCILPFVEYEFLRTYLYAQSSSLDAYVLMDELPSSETLENFKGLYDENNSLLQNYDVTFDLAKTI